MTILNKTTRGRTADKHYRSHHEIDTIIGHSLGGAVALSLEKQCKKEYDNPYGTVQYKTFGSPAVSGNISNPLLKNIVKDEIVGAGVASGLAIGASADSAIGFSDGGLLYGLGADIGKKISSDFLIELHKLLGLGKFRSETHRDNSSVRWDVSAVQVTGYQNDKSPKQCNKPNCHCH